MDLDLGKTPRTLPQQMRSVRNRIFPNEPSAQILIIGAARIERLERELNRLRNPAPMDEKEFDAMALRVADEIGIKFEPRFGQTWTGNIQILEYARRLREQILKESAAGQETKVNTSGTVHQPKGETTSGTASSADQPQGVKHER